eukprot:CAMPEP_0114281050 /NCGR_PEP_ID=MMETSP0059-20121206/2772_1 /TAXON_ID=36894 /ORGANISM="Pyramimonas parkeae, Strain CCMP726" /LENGTH=193 /DNA_ID=CAMNT_0001401507 /DNA_START=1972 /DNA_END=2553 /DNA_ORIENTATION=-
MCQAFTLQGEQGHVRHMQALAHVQQLQALATPRDLAHPRVCDSVARVYVEHLQMHAQCGQAGEGLVRDPHAAVAVEGAQVPPRRRRLQRAVAHAQPPHVQRAQVRTLPEADQPHVGGAAHKAQVQHLKHGALLQKRPDSRVPHLRTAHQVQPEEPRTTLSDLLQAVVGDVGAVGEVDGAQVWGYLQKSGQSCI